jgi:hypothetical protein
MTRQFKPTDLTLDSYCPIVTLMNQPDIPEIILDRLRSNTIETKIGIPALQGDKLNREGTYGPAQFSARRKSGVLIQLIWLSRSVFKPIKFS